MRQKLLNSIVSLIAISMLLTFVAASMVMYGKFSENMKQDVYNESQYVLHGIEKFGREYLTGEVGNITSTRITLLDKDGTVLMDSHKDVTQMENHSDRPEFIEAKEKGKSETSRFSNTLAKQTFYYAVRLEDGSVLRVARTTDSVLKSVLSSFTLIGILFMILLVAAFAMVDGKMEKLITPINKIDLEHPLEHVEYEEFRPLLSRLDEQNQQIAKQMEELQKAEVVRREFSANVSHELKTPLMSISGYAELMKNQMVRSKDIPEFAGRIYSEASRLNTLVQDIISLSKLDDTKRETVFEEIDVYELSQDIYDTLKNPADKKNIQLSVEGDSCVMMGVYHILYEMFYNLVDNAIRYTDCGGKVQVEVKKRDDGDIDWIVTDNGIGIAKNEQERIFERFYRVDKSHSRETGGTGLGLSIVKHGAQLHNARISLKSELGEGTRIKIHLKNTIRN